MILCPDAERHHILVNLLTPLKVDVHAVQTEDVPRTGQRNLAFALTAEQSE